MTSWSRLGAALLLCAVGGCAAKSIRGVSGVTGVRSVGATLVVEAIVREPDKALDAPVAIGQAIALIGARIRKGARDVPTGARNVVVNIRLIDSADAAREVPLQALSLTVSVSRARDTDWHALIAQEALNIVTAIPRATPGARAMNAAYCTDPAHAALSGAFCRLVASRSAARI